MSGEDETPDQPTADTASTHDRFSPEEEARLVSQANAHKIEANALFASGSFDAAMEKYDEAVAACPTYLHFERAVLKSNTAACHVRLAQWKDAIGSATVALDELAMWEPAEGHATATATATATTHDGTEPPEAHVDEAVVVSGPDTRCARTASRPEDVQRIRAKALMRRARARSELGSWSNLEGALEDYNTLAAMTNLTRADRDMVQGQLRSLPVRVKAAQESETAEMWGKLKDLGNGLLKPFGMSTDNFQMVKDEKTGGYSMNFRGGGG